MGEAALAYERQQAQEVAAASVLRLVTPDFVPPSAFESETDIHAERYAHSLRTIAKVGELGVRECLDSEEGRTAEQMLRTDFLTSIGEMLKTDPDLRHELDIEPHAVYGYRDGHAVMANGKPIVNMIRDGYKASKERAKDKKNHPFMAGQAERDGEDVLNAERVDRLEVGKMLVVPSVEPKAGYARSKEESKFWDSLGYREGMMFFQWYYRQDETTLVSGSLSIEGSDTAVLRALLEGYGQQLPGHIPDAQWLRHGIEFDASGDAEDAKALAKFVRKQYYRLQGTEEQRLSVTEYLEANHKLLNQVFEEVYIPMTRSNHHGKKEDIIRDFVAELLQNADKMRPEIRAQLMRIHNSKKFDAEATRIVDFMIRYGTVERLREPLVAMRKAREASRSPGGEAFGLAPLPQEAFRIPVAVPDSSSSIASTLATNVAKGANAGRSYGGCTADVNMAKESGSDSDSNPQDSYGGKAKQESGETSEVCVVETDGCYCCGLNTDGSDRSNRLTVKAFIDSRGTIHCMRGGCGAWLSKGGKEKYIGLIAKRAEYLKRKTAKQDAGPEVELDNHKQNA